MNAGLAIRGAPALLLTMTLAACDERDAGLPERVLGRADAIEVVTEVDGRPYVQAPLRSAVEKERVAKAISGYSEWPEVPACATPFCHEVVAEWKIGVVTVGQVGVCSDRVTIHIPGPQDCGRIPPLAPRNALLDALAVKR